MRRSTQRRRKRRRKGTQSHHWGEGGTSIKNLRTATCSMPRLGKRGGKEKESAMIAPGSQTEAPRT